MRQRKLGFTLTCKRVKVKLYKLHKAILHIFLVRKNVMKYLTYLSKSLQRNSINNLVFLTYIHFTTVHVSVFIKIFRNRCNIFTNENSNSTVFHCDSPYDAPKENPGKTTDFRFHQISKARNTLEIHLKIDLKSVFLILGFFLCIYR